MPPINPTMILASIEIGRQYFEKTLTRQEALLKLINTFGWNESSASRWLHKYIALRRGERYTTLSSDKTYELILPIAEKEGWLNELIHAVEKHFKYYSTQGSNSKRKIELIEVYKQKRLDANYHPFLGTQYKNVSFWWVNQKKTHKQEHAGNYMWSPQKNRNGNRNQFYVNMTLVSPGDLVFAYVKKRITKIGIIQNQAIVSEKPENFGTAGLGWSKYGWLVATKWFDVPVSIEPQSIIHELSSLLPSKYSPLKENGEGKELYLTSISNQIASILLKHTQVTKSFLNTIYVVDDAAADVLINTNETKIEQQIQEDKDLSETEVDAVIKARKGHGTYKRNLQEIEKKCRVTNVTDPNLLIASHIKPWSMCETHYERLDGNNGLLLTPTYDLLFDRGYISFENNGDMLISDALDTKTREKLGINHYQTNVGSFNQQQAKYLAFHREVRFKK